MSPILLTLCLLADQTTFTNCCWLFFLFSLMLSWVLRTLIVVTIHWVIRSVKISSLYITLATLIYQPCMTKCQDRNWFSKAMQCLSFCYQMFFSRVFLVFLELFSWIVFLELLFLNCFSWIVFVLVKMNRNLSVAFPIYLLQRISTLLIEMSSLWGKWSFQILLLFIGFLEVNVLLLLCRPFFSDVTIMFMTKEDNVAEIVQSEMILIQSLCLANVFGPLVNLILKLL